ncbi:MAG: glycerol-3-phosphate 1-O-acyltransferase PlsY [Oscillospiraceae bacterium]
MSVEMLFPLAVVALVSYLLGSINFAVIISRIYAGDDVRKHGSGNAGMTNMLRTYGKTPAILTAAGDFAKAVVAICLARFVIFPLVFGLPGQNIDGIDPGYVAGFFVLIGHIFPLFFHFKGGKGVMSSLGVLAVLDPIVFLAILVICLPIVFISRMVSLGSVTGAILLPIFTFIWRLIQGRNPAYDTVCAAVIAALVLFMHRENIGRLLKGTENRFGSKK